jgi:hypothetical protein
MHCIGMRNSNQKVDFIIPTSVNSVIEISNNTKCNERFDSRLHSCLQKWFCYSVIHMEGRWFHLEWLFDIVVLAKYRELPTDTNQSKVYFIISYFHIFKHSNCTLSALKVSSTIIYNSFLISKWLEWLLMAVLPFRVLVVRNNTFYHSVQTQKLATFRIWKNVTMNSQMPSIVFAVLTAQWKLLCTKSPSKPTN